MPIPETLQKAWDSANQLLESGEPKKALEILRSEAWDECENAMQKARTLRYAGDAGMMLGEVDTARQKRHWQKAHKSYRNALGFDPKDKEARRSMNKLASMMDEKAISLGVGMQLFDEGNPTPLGLVAMLVAGMLLLVSFKVAPTGSTTLRTQLLRLRYLTCPQVLQRGPRHSSRLSCMRMTPHYMSRTSCFWLKSRDTTSPYSTGLLTDS
ncbi:MAG: hypothetical protein CM1200mP21_01520 [Candidatus Poseidoniales archaeon]|nr:MAG: hypothetical protein CM1200mP21_01520 [Candidatus Poseidoniales archaeon]